MKNRGLAVLCHIVRLAGTSWQWSEGPTQGRKGEARGGGGGWYGARGGRGVWGKRVGVEKRYRRAGKGEVVLVSLVAR